jgi:hypothetical protein
VTQQPRIDAQAQHRRVRLMLVVWLVLMLGAMLVLATLLRPYNGHSPVNIELARDAQGFEQALAIGWRSTGGTTCGIGEAADIKGASINRLRCHLFVDSMFFVPGYVGLLGLLTLSLARRAGMHNVWLCHLLCVPAVAAGLFDIAENGITIVAAEELLIRLLSDATVLDLRLASLTKWWLAAAAFALVGLLALRAVRSVADDATTRRWQRWGGGLAIAAAIALAAALVVAHGAAGDPRPEFGMLLAVLAALALARWRWRSSDPNP